MDNDNAAENLVGLTLDTGWVVIEKLDMLPGDTGRFFSVCYKVKREEEICFLKAFNFAKFFQISKESGKQVQVVDVMKEMSKAFIYERDLSLLCRDKHVTQVVFVKDSGQQSVSGYSFANVPYLIFDLADGNIRTKLNFSQDLDIAWKLKSLHSVANGLRQLHAIDVSHQDLKPSNILLFDKDSKIGDLGCSTCKSLDSPYMDFPFAGDYNYAPPEFLYGYYESDWKKRSFSTDCYLFGSLIVFYFSGISMNALLRKNLHDNVSWENYNGPFDDVRAYLLEAFSKALDEFDKCITNDVLRKELRIMVEYLCYPLPEKRGHPKNIGNIYNQYDLERVLSSLDYLHKKVKYELFHRV